MWIIIAQIICIAAAVGLLAIFYDLDRETPAVARYSVLIFSAAFIAVFGASHRNPEVYEHAAAIAFSGVGIMVLTIVGYLTITKHIQPIVLRVSGGALGLIMLLWLVGSCSDMKRQKMQINSADAVADTIRTADSTKAAIEQFNKLSN